MVVRASVGARYEGHIVKNVTLDYGGFFVKDMNLPSKHVFRLRAGDKANTVLTTRCLAWSDGT